MGGKIETKVTESIEYGKLIISEEEKEKKMVCNTISV